MERGIEDAEANARYSHREQPAARPPPRRRKTSVTWADGHGAIVQRLSGTLASLVDRVSGRRSSRASGRASRSSTHRVEVEPGDEEAADEDDQQQQDAALKQMPMSAAGVDRSGSSLRCDA